MLQIPEVFDFISSLLDTSEKMLEESLGAIRGLKNTLIADLRGKMSLPNARKTE